MCDERLHNIYNISQSRTEIITHKTQGTNICKHNLLSVHRRTALIWYQWYTHSARLDKGLGSKTFVEVNAKWKPVTVNLKKIKQTNPQKIGNQYLTNQNLEIQCRRKFDNPGKNKTDQK